MDGIENKKNAGMAFCPSRCNGGTVEAGFLT